MLTAVCDSARFLGGIVTKQVRDKNGLRHAEEVFAKEYVKNGCTNASAAYRIAHPNLKASQTNTHTKASAMLNKPEVQARIEQLRQIAIDKCEKEFSISITQRLKWLEEVATAGLDQWHDQSGNARRENLAATVGAIKVINEMLGITTSRKGVKKSYNLTLMVEGKSDISKVK